MVGARHPSAVARLEVGAELTDIVCSNKDLKNQQTDREK